MIIAHASCRITKYPIERGLGFPLSKTYRRTAADRRWPLPRKHEANAQKVKMPIIDSIERFICFSS